MSTNSGNLASYLKEKSPSVETERPLTIACHMKNLYKTNDGKLSISLRLITSLKNQQQQLNQQM